MNKTESIKLERARHHNALEALARNINPKSTQSGLAIYRKLHRIETVARRSAEQYCNGEIDLEQWQSVVAIATNQVESVFGMLPTGFFVNGDPRGYALKLESDDDTGKTATPFELYQDWGRNQILAPTID